MEIQPSIFFIKTLLYFFFQHMMLMHTLALAYQKKKGHGKGMGFNVNIHLPCNSNDQDILNVFKNNLIKKANLFEPDFILLSAGFDSRENDPLGCFKITDDGFRSLTEIVIDIAEKHCNGRILSILEGGYNINGNASAVTKHVETLNKYNKKV